MSTRRFVYEPEPYDRVVDDYEENYPDMSDEDRYYAYQEDNSLYMRQLMDMVRDAYASVCDPDTGEDPIFHKVDIYFDDSGPYGRYPEGALIVDVEAPDSASEIEDAWTIYQNNLNTYPDEGGRHTHQAVARFQRESRLMERMYSALGSMGFDEVGYGGDTNAMEFWGMRPFEGMPESRYPELYATKTPYDWPSRSRRSRSQVAVGRSRPKAPSKPKARSGTARSTASRSVRPKAKAVKKFPAKKTVSKTGTKSEVSRG